MSTETDEKQGGWAQMAPARAMEPDVAEDWSKARNRLAQVAQAQNLSKSEVARRSDIPLGTLSPWYDGKYAGNVANVTAKVIMWLDALEERRAQPTVEIPGYIETPTSRKVCDTLLFAQTMPSMVSVTLGSGCGKSTAARHFAETRPSVFMATMRPTTKNTYTMLRELARTLGVGEKSPTLLDTAIGEKLKRNGRQTLLVIDEAQNLNDDAVNQLRFFLDEYHCGIALLGNMDVHTRFGGATPREGQGQLHRRIGKRLYQLHPTDGDVEALLDAWRLSDEKLRRIARAIARKPGALGQVSETLKLAHMLAAGDAVGLEPKHLTSAWINRGNEEIR